MPTSRNPIEPDQLLAYLTSGQTMGPLLGGGLPSPKALYAAAYDLYNEGKFDEALPIFLHLIVVNHLDKRYYDGAGACLQQLRRYKDAIAYHSVSMLLNITDPLPALRAAECNLALGDRERAHADLEHALRHCDAPKSDKHRAVADRAGALLGFLNAAKENEGHPKPSAAKTNRTAKAMSSMKE